MTTPKEHDGRKSSTSQDKKRERPPRTALKKLRTTGSREAGERQGATSFEQQITEWIRNILKQYEPGDEISAKFLFAKLVAHPERYGAPGVHGLPKLDKFEQVCRAMFHTRKERGELVVKVMREGGR